MDNLNSLIHSLITGGYLKTPAIVEAFRKIDRKGFVPEAMKVWAYLDQPLSIGQGQTIYQPLTVAFMLELLEPAAGQKVLDVGTGSGWQAALLAEIAGTQGLVVSIERIKSLSESARQNLSKFNFNNLKLVVGDGSLGYLQEALYDRIIAAASSNLIPQTWQDQLKPGGVIVAPVGESLVKLVKIGDGKFKKEEYPGFVFVPLIIE